MRFRPAPLVLPVLLVLLTSRAWAGDAATDEAKAHVRKATAAYNLGRYLEAAKEYEAAYEETLDAKLLFNVAQAYRLGGDREKAITTYRSFIRSDPKSDLRGLAESKLRELEQQHPSASPAGAIPPPPAVAAPPPLASTSPPPVTPLAVPAAGVPAAGAAAGGPPEATAVTVAAPPPAGRMSRGVVVGGVVTGALAVGAVVTGVLYSGKLHDYNTANEQLAANRADLRSQTNTLGAVNLALIGGALVAAGVTVVLWTRGPSHDATSASVELRGVVTPTLSALCLTGSL